MQISRLIVFTTGRTPKGTNTVRRAVATQHGITSYPVETIHLRRVDTFQLNFERSQSRKIARLISEGLTSESFEQICF